MSALGVKRLASVSGDRADFTRARALHHAVYALALRSPMFSARTIITKRQAAVLVAAVALLVTGLILWSAMVGRAIVLFMSLGFIFSLLMRTYLASIGHRSRVAVAAAMGADMPIYTVLVPMYREAGMLPQMAKALGALDYPADRLDIKLVLEEDDLDTRAAADALGRFEIVVVPPAQPRTKPKACNYALHFARGEFVVVYDAEDRPEPDQLRKAVGAFRQFPQTQCFQARLAIDHRPSWLASMFALDYGIWFRTLLPGLDRLKAPIPLGGTSNHFRTETLVAAGAWDPFNVTEDADLGFRLARLGHRVSMLHSVTFEEAPSRFGPWFRQRTRWMKGYMQTLLVHTRQPRHLVARVGVRGCLVMQAFLGGAVWSALVNPLLWIVFLGSVAGRGAAPDTLDLMARASGGTLLIANALLAALALVDGRIHGRMSGTASALSYPLYWMLISAAAYRALWQLLRDPYRWEKTPHGDAVA